MRADRPRNSQSAKAPATPARRTTRHRPSTRSVTARAPMTRPLATRTRIPAGAQLFTTLTSGASAASANLCLRAPAEAADAALVVGHGSLEVVHAEIRPELL